MRQNTSSPRTNLPFQCFHTCTAPTELHNPDTVLFVRGASSKRLSIKLVAFPQHEPVRIEMLYTGSKAGIHRFAAHLPIDEGSNIQRYCFKISLLNNNYQVVDVVWYSSLGMSRECPLLSHCFAFNEHDPAPTWIENLVLYQVFPDRFASSKGYFSIDMIKYDPIEFIHDNTFEYKDLNTLHCGGDLDGLSNMLPYIRDLGCDGIYLTPIFKSPSPHKYDTEDYDIVDSHFGGNGALKRLRKTAVSYEMNLLLCVPMNHTSHTHHWFDRHDQIAKGALHHKDSPFRDYYTFNDNDEPIYWKASPNMPKLNYASKQLRLAMYQSENSVIKKWLRPPYGIDGYIIDCASQIGDHGTSKNNLKRLSQICESARAVQKECLMIGQFTSDARYALTSDNNIDGSINYTGFLSPMRAFFGGTNLTGDSTPYTGEDFRRTCENYSVGVAQQTKLCLINQLDNHDLPRFFNIIGGEKSLYLSALAVLYTYRGIPCVYQGDELGDVINQYEIGPRSPLPFLLMKNHKVSPYSAEIQANLKTLAAIRRSNSAITLGSLVFICAGGAYFGYIRLYQNRFSVVFVNASRQAMTIDQGSILFPLLAAIYLPKDVNDADEQNDSGENILIPLSGRNIRRTDHGEGLEALYELLAREKLTVYAFGQTKSSESFTQSFLEEFTAGKTITMPARTTVIINNN